MTAQLVVLEGGGYNWVRVGLPPFLRWEGKSQGHLTQPVVTMTSPLVVFVFRGVIADVIADAIVAAIAAVVADC